MAVDLVADVEDEQLPLIAHEVYRGGGLPLVPAPPVRDWMSAAPHGNPKRCLPLLIGSSFGWHVLARTRIVAAWPGGDEPEHVVVLEECGEPGWPRAAESIFGLGVVTVHPGLLFRTPPGWALLVTEPFNAAKDGIRGLTGVVETAWSPATFTINWKFVRPGLAACWEPGEPIAQIVPVRLRELERFAPEVRALRDEPELQAAYSRWSAARDEHRTTNRDPKKWQADYQRGAIAGVHAEEHLTRLRLRPFTRRAVGTPGPHG